MIPRQSPMMPGGPMLSNASMMGGSPMTMLTGNPAAAAGMFGDPAQQAAQVQAQAAQAALMWQMQMASPHQNPATMMPPWGNPMMPPPSSPVLNVRVEGLKFEYQLTEDD